MTTADLQARLAQAFALHQQGDFARAGQLYRNIIASHPSAFDALHLLGVLEAQRGDAAAAVELFDRALRINRNNAVVHSNRGNALLDLGQPTEALTSYERALKLQPANPEAHNNRGNALADLNRFDEALASYDRALRIRADYPQALNNRGNVLIALNRFDEARAACDAALHLLPDYPQALNNRGIALSRLGRHAEAVADFQHALQLQPEFIDALNNCGSALLALQKTAEAATVLEKALARSPGNAQAHNNLGNVMTALNRHADARTCYDRALAAQPDMADALNNRAGARLELKDVAGAMEDFAKLLELDPDYPYARGRRFGLQLQQCDWNGYDANTGRILRAIEKSDRVAPPFNLLTFRDEAAAQLACASTFVADQMPRGLSPLCDGGAYRHAKIRVAYLSADFHDHPVAQLMAGLIEAHDRNRFEVFGISFGPDVECELRRRLKRGFDHFIDVSADSDAAVAQRLRELEIDIAVDLMGHTKSSRMGIFARRPAPLQVNFLGYPGTTGADFIDYLIADPVVIPPGAEGAYREKIVRLPASFMPPAAGRAIAETPTREAAGLPDSGFVFCCFNNHYKITPPLFDCWMRLLGQIDGSVLWLSKGNEVVERNLRTEAVRRGIAAERLIFAPRTERIEDHLARQRLADLFLDTLPYNAHATAVDALCAGLPLLTCAGGAFAGRVAASLLTAVDLPELITNTPDEYEARALGLARDADQLMAVRRKLAGHLAKAPLFDVNRYARNIENAFAQIQARLNHGESAAHLDLRAAQI